MKLRILSAIIMLASSAAALFAQPKLYWLETVHDFGAFHEDVGVAYCTFRAVNTGNAPVTVLNARANCGCTRPECPHTPVMPGDTLNISVAYDATGRPGKFSKQVRVETNVATVNLLLKGTVIGSPTTLTTRYPVEAGRARLSNAMTAFGQTTKGRVLAAAVNIYNPTDSPMRPAVDSLPPYVNAIFRPEVINSGEQATLSLTAYTDRVPDYGVITDRFILIPDSEGAPEARTPIATTVIVNEDFSSLSPEDRANAPVATLSEKVVNFDRLTPGNHKETRTFTITNTGGRQLIIRRIFTADPALDIQLRQTKIAPGKSATVRLTVDCSLLKASQPLNARVNIIANAPAEPSQAVRVIGEVYQ